MGRPSGILALNNKLADAAPRARVTLAALVELLGRDEPLRMALYAAVARSADFMFWPRLIPRPVIVPQDAPRHAPGRAEQLAKPSAPPAPERAPERTAGPVQVAAPAAAAGGLGAGAGQGAGAAAAAAPRRGVFGRRAPAPDDGGLAALHAAIADRLGGVQ